VRLINRCAPYVAAV